MAISADTYLWVEKYRPKTLNQMVLKPEEAKIFNSWIQNKEIPNTLFVGKPGSGKTTLARILVDHILKSKGSDMLLLNGSTQRGIDVVRDQIEEFLKTIVMGGSKIKIVFLDEADFLTRDAQGALRHIIEKYSDKGRFLLTANYETKIEPAIMSRMQTFRFSELPIEYIVQYCEYILKKENVSYDVEAIKKVVKTHHPDIRKIIGILQSRSRDGKLSFDVSDIESNENKVRSLVTDLVAAIKAKDMKDLNSSFQKIEKVLSDFDMDYQSLYEALGKDRTLPFWVVPVVSMHYDKHYNCASPQLNFMAMLSNLIRAGARLRDIQ
jgi:replication factor C small subunit